MERWRDGGREKGGLEKGGREKGGRNRSGRKTWFHSQSIESRGSLA